MYGKMSLFIVNSKRDKERKRLLLFHVKNLGKLWKGRLGFESKARL